MSKPIEHIEVIEKELHAINQDKHIITADEYVVMGDLQDKLHDLRKCFEYNKGLHGEESKSGTTAGEIIDDTDSKTKENPDGRNNA